MSAPATPISPFRQPRAVYAVAFACVVSFMGIGLVDPILPALAEQLHASRAQVSLLLLTARLGNGRRLPREEGAAGRSCGVGRWGTAAAAAPRPAPAQRTSRSGWYPSNRAGSGIVTRTGAGTGSFSSVRHATVKARGAFTATTPASRPSST
jgi:hypothetical protein